jgi:NitT/TauT family transport system permease protein
MAVGRELVLPSPASVIKALAQLSVTAEFWTSAAMSLMHVFTGFVCGTAAATLLCVLTCSCRWADILVSPLMRVMRTAPVASFIILLQLWTGKNAVPGIISAIMVTPVVYSGTYQAVKGTDVQLIEMAQMYKISRFNRFRLLYVPSALPAWKQMCITAIGLAWKSGVAAEVLCLARPSAGAELYYSKIYLETPSLFAWTVVVIALSWALEKLFKFIFGRKKHDRV